MSAFISNSELYCTLVGAVGVVFALLTAAQVKSAPAGDEKMNQIADAVKEGAIAYLNRQLKTVFVAAAVIVVIIGATLGVTTAVGFILGAAASYLAGDTEGDIASGNAAGCKTILLTTGPNGSRTIAASPDYVADSLLQAAEWIVTNGSIPPK